MTSVFYLTYLTLIISFFPIIFWNLSITPEYSGFPELICTTSRFSSCFIVFHSFGYSREFSRKGIYFKIYIIKYRVVIILVEIILLVDKISTVQFPLNLLISSQEMDMSQTWIYITKRYFLPSLLDINPIVLEKKILMSSYVYSLCCSFLLLNGMTFSFQHKLISFIQVCFTKTYTTKDKFHTNTNALTSVMI